MTRRTIILLCVFLSMVLGGAMPVSSQEVSARASVDSADYLVGDWIAVHIGVMHPSGARIRPLVGDTLGGFQVIGRDSLQKKSETESATGLVVSRYDSGSAILPPISFLYTLAGDSTSRVVSTNALMLTVHTVRVDTSAEFKDIKPPLWVSLTLAEIAFIVGILLLISAAAYFGYRYWKKRQQKEIVEEYVPPPRPAHVIALEELAVLKDRKLWQQGLIKQYYSEVTEIMRRYFENRFSFMALEQTTEEIMHALKKHPRAETIGEETERVLRRADLVKFAKYRPSIPDHEEMLTVAFDVVDKTALVDTQPAAIPENKVHADVVS